MHRLCVCNNLKFCLYLFLFIFYILSFVLFVNVLAEFLYSVYSEYCLYVYM